MEKQNNIGTVAIKTNKKEIKTGVRQQMIKEIIGNVTAGNLGLEQI